MEQLFKVRRIISRESFFQRPDSGMPTAPQIPKKSQHAKAPVHPKYRTSEIMSTPRKDSGSIEKENLP